MICHVRGVSFSRQNLLSARLESSIRAKDVLLSSLLFVIVALHS